MSEEASRSRVLVVGATGRLGGSLVRASIAFGHPTFALVRPHHFALPDSAPLKPLAAAGAMLLKVNAPVISSDPPVPCPPFCSIDLPMSSGDSGGSGRLPELARGCAAGGCGHLRGAD
jgi:hypothetical protein